AKVGRMSVQRVNALGGYEDWPAYLDQAPPATGGGLWDVLRPPTPPEQVPLRYGRTSTADGVRTQLLSWQLGVRAQDAGLPVHPGAGHRTAAGDRADALPFG